jgi:nickel/cobalt transporter (NiCoT) family protein
MPATWNALCALVFLLGLRHGFDADHLAAIDGMTRMSACQGRRHARYCGVLFSLGHGVVVLAIALSVASLRSRWQPPHWLDATGACISIGFLLLIGVANLRAAIVAAPGSVVALVGVKGRLLAPMMQANRPRGVALVGALFALSFDTISQSALFAMTATQFGGLVHALTLALLFVLGMLAADGLNGWWISRLLSRADQTAALASRVMSLAVSVASLLVAAFGIGKLLSPRVEQWGEGKESMLGLALILLITASYLLARRFTRPCLPVSEPA